ncbi:Uncharacterised protein [Chlamydia trachomatis]|nr:Uncharacterised protein [Chlamydia trachomatis]CRH53922.1 Uncharacterised protein [Chlamydia trachomatis]
MFGNKPPHGPGLSKQVFQGYVRERPIHTKATYRRLL